MAEKPTTLLDIARLRELTPAIIAIGSHPRIIQSILDFDYLAGRSAPSVLAIIAAGRNRERYFFGRQEVMLTVYPSSAELPPALRARANLILVLTSGRRVQPVVTEALAHLPNLVGGSIFAEEVPERAALALQRAAAERGIWLAGGASVGLVVPPTLKLGAIGGVEAAQLEAAKLFGGGHIAVISSSGGMVNELIRIVAASGQAISFAAALGGERFPMLTPADAWLAAEGDPATRAIVYFGELGGHDEYALAELRRSGQVTKPAICYIAGTVATLFEVPPQFGHAGAIAEHQDESAEAKRQALTDAGAQAAASFAEFVKLIQSLKDTKDTAMPTDNPPHTSKELEDRRPALVASSVSGDVNGVATVLGSDILELASQHSFAWMVASLTLGRPITSKQLEEFVDFVLRLLVDHGPYVSGAVNTIVTARAGRDMVSSLAAGLLTIGPRFGGAINQAAEIWLEGVQRGLRPDTLVEEYAGSQRYIAGIGHRKYRVDLPDPRVVRLLEFVQPLKHKPFTEFAQGVEAVTVRKKGNLILNIDGAIAAVLLDLLAETEGYTPEQLAALTQAEFFNALFVLSRSVGFVAHFLDQKRLDEGLLRLRETDVAIAPAEAAHEEPDAG